MSRPEIPIDWKKVDDLLIAGCLGTEIAAHFNIHPDTFYRRVEEKFGMGYTAYSNEKRFKGDSILRAKQFETAIKGNVTMQIWLGKQRLDQKEHFDAPSAPNDQKLDALLADVKAMREGNIKPPPPSEEIKDPVAE